MNQEVKTFRRGLFTPQQKLDRKIQQYAVKRGYKIVSIEVKHNFTTVVFSK